MQMCQRHAAKFVPSLRVWELMRQPWQPAAAFLARMQVNFGWRFCLILVSAYFGVKGALYTFAGLVQLPYYKSLGVSGRDYQIYGSIAVTPFSLKVDPMRKLAHSQISAHTHTHTHTLTHSLTPSPSHPHPHTTCVYTHPLQVRAAARGRGVLRGNSPRPNR